MTVLKAWILLRLSNHDHSIGAKPYLGWLRHDTFGRARILSMKSPLLRIASLSWLTTILWVNFGVLSHRGAGVLGYFNLIAASMVVNFQVIAPKTPRPSAREIFLALLGSLVGVSLLWLVVNYEQGLPRTTATCGTPNSIGPGFDWANENIVWLSAGIAVMFACVQAFRYWSAIRRSVPAEGQNSDL